MQVKNIYAANQTEAAKCLGISPRTLREWVEAPRNKDRSYEIPALIEWRTKKRVRDECAKFGVDDPDVDSPSLERWREAKADREEIRLAEDMRQVVRVGDVRGLWVKVLSSLRQTFTGLGSQLAPSLAHRDAHDIKVVLDERITEAMVEAVELYGDSLTEEEEEPAA